MRLQDQEEFQEWLGRRKSRSRDLGIKDDDDKCAGCGISADEQKIVEGECMECLSLAFGVHTAEWRITRITQAIVTTFAATDARRSHILIQHIVDQLEEALIGYDKEVQA